MGKHEHHGPVARPARDRASRYRWVLAGLAIALGVSALVAIPAVALTEQSRFCTSCHEMRPYYDAFAIGAHRNISCVDCHVDGGVPARVAHKVVALKEVYDHFTSSPKFPQVTAVVVPDSRCEACHRDLGGVRNGFDHSVHVGQLKCEACHKDAGHTVTPQALAQAGILSATGRAQVASSATLVASTATSTPTVNATSTGDYSPEVDRIANHAAVKCLTCHAIDSFRCSNCHTAPHAPRGECATCHRADPGSKPWQFAHPSSATCSDCHSAKHADRGACAKCHAPGPTWTFSHPGQTADCVQCHDKPTAASHTYRTKCASCHQLGVPFAKTTRPHTSGDVCVTCHDTPGPKHATTACATCHRAGVSWAFSHPRRTDCSTCHRPPKVHYGTSCANCHKVGTAWKSARVDHGVVGTGCVSCHTPPSNHSGRSSACVSCHRRAGASWAFSHPSSSSCASCHTPPANHFGSGCASCHTPTRPFKSATFTHKSVGMSVTSMACTSCHPKGYATHTCAPCHSSPPSGD